MSSANASDTQIVNKATEQYRLFEMASQPLFKKYEAAIREMQTRFEILDADLEYRLSRNPIHHIESRIKAPRSVYDKLHRYGVPITVRSMEENILDIAGMRVIVSYVDDVKALVKVLSLQDDLQIVKVKDYISHPKPNGYRSLHIIVKVPVYFLDRKQYVPVEIQLRTIAMDFWASLEHTLKYKQDVKLEGIDMYDELKDCSAIIEDVERRMQILMRAVETSDVEEAANDRRRQIEERGKAVAAVKPSA
jgi:putative GTP pyrophosphokinase